MAAFSAIQAWWFPSVRVYQNYSLFLWTSYWVALVSHAIDCLQPVPMS